ncbi:MAG: hypothetical protein K0V04_07270 [Deltaproteobacteria bacterium]|nr:hypothetical protein [Deltaproteobacteria bacterium]
MAWRRRTAALLLALSTACGYQSTYVPPDADHYRVVWRGNRLEMVGPPTIEHCIGNELVELPPGLASARDTRSEPSPPLWATASLHDDDDDDDDDDAAGVAQTIIGVVILSTAIASTALVLALAPAGRPRDNASALTTTRLRNDQIRRARKACTASSSLDLPEPRP